MVRSSIVAPPRKPAAVPLGSPPRLPFHIALGPYRLAVVFVERSELMDRRRLACINIEAGRIELRSDLVGTRLVEAFFDCLVRLAHFSKGCQQGCIEEAYTHSFATGMVEFAQRNPKAWLWFNLLLGKHLCPRQRFDRIVRGAVARPPRMPHRLVVGNRTVTIRSIPKSQTGSAFGWYHFSRLEAQLYHGLTGANLAVVALHEITHSVHHAYDIKQRDLHRNFRRAQVQGWMRLIRDNPAAWRWLAWSMSFPLQASLAPPPQRRAA